MRSLPAAVAGLIEPAMDVLPGDENYMTRRFLVTQLAQGFGAAAMRQSFLWMAPFGPNRMAALWRRSALPQDAIRDGAFAIVDRRAAEDGNVTSVERLAYPFLTTSPPQHIPPATDR